MELVMLALAIAAKAHSKQLRKGLGEPYINHPIRVARMVLLGKVGGGDLEIERAVCAALLHDVVEDTDMTKDDLVEAGMPQAVTDLTMLLTKWWPDSSDSHVDNSDNKKSYYNLILDNPTAISIKLLDRADNVNDMRLLLLHPQCSRSQAKWARRYLAKTRSEMTPLFDRETNAYVRLVYDVMVQSLEDTVTASKFFQEA